MVPRLARTKTLAATFALAVLSACTRSGPPAPVYVLGNDAKPAPNAPAAPVKATPAPPKIEPARIEPPKVETTKIEPAKMPPPALEPQEHLPHPDQVVVGKGETLYMIARRYDVPLRSIIDANHLDPPFQVAAGTSLVLPQERFHVVKAGDTLYSVARVYGVDVSTLARLNHLAEPFAIRAGEALELPAPVAAVERVASAPPARPASGTKPAEASAPAAPAPPPEPPPAAKPVPEQTVSAGATPGPKPRGSRVFAWPLEGRVIASYGTAPSGTHNDGINIAARQGEPVRAADAGKVAYAGNELRGYGNLVLIKHVGGYMTAYAHNSKLLVRRGEVVKRGQEIAKAGATGTVNTPQLHFEIRQGTRALDPANYLPSLRASAD